MLRSWTIASATIAQLGLASLAAQAAPLQFAETIRDTAQAASPVEHIASPRCWWRNGERHCSRRDLPRRAYRDSEYPSYGRGRPEDYPTGSKAWWQAMDDEGRGGHGRLP